MAAELIDELIDEATAWAEREAEELGDDAYSVTMIRDLIRAVQGGAGVSIQDIADVLNKHEITLTINEDQLGEPDENGARRVIKSRCLCGALIDNDAGAEQGWMSFSLHQAEALAPLLGIPVPDVSAVPA